MFEKIVEIIRNEAGLSIEPDVDIELETDLISDLHVDSLDIVLIIGDIESEFGINIDNSEVQGIRTVKNIMDKINELKAEEKVSE